MSKATPFFSIVTVNLNNKDELQSTMKSVNEQSFDDWEQNIIDGCSVDGALDFLKLNPLSYRYDFISEKDDGLYDAMNKGLALSNGKYVLFLNSGDCLADKDVLQKVYNSIKEFNNPDVFYGGVFEITENDKVFYKSPKSRNSIWNSTPTRHQSIFYKKNIVNDKKYDLNLKIAADVAYTAELFLDERITVAYSDFAVSNFMQGGVSYSNNWLVMKENWYIRRKVFKFGVLKSLRIVLYRHFIRLFQQKIPFLYDLIRYGK